MSAAPPDPHPFIPTADAIHGHKRQWSHPIPQAYALPRSMSSNTIVRAPIPIIHPPRGVVSQSSAAPAPYPHPDHAALQMRLPPRPLGHGRSGSSQPPIPPPIAIPVLPADAKPVNQHATEKDLPKAPATGGLGLFVRNEPLTPIQQPLPPNPPVIVPVPPTSAPLVAPPPPPAPVNIIPSNPQPRPRPTRRNTVSECQRLPTPEASSEDAIHKEHVRLDALWEQEQEQLRREMDDERKKYEAKLRSMGQDIPPPKSSRKKSKSPTAHSQRQHHHQSDSPVMNEHGIPSPPPSGSPPHKSTHDERERWRQEIRRVMEDQAQKQELAKQEFVRAMHAQEQERLMRENYLRHQARLQAEAQAKARALEHHQHQQHPQQFARHPLPPTRDAPYPAPPRPQFSFAPIPTKEARRARRKAQRESGYASGGGRSTDGRSAAGGNWRSTRPKRYYGEGTTDLRDEGMDGDRFEEVDESWEDVESPGAQEARMVKAAWDLYESRWNQLTTVSPPKENSLRFIDIPWPSMEPLPTPMETSGQYKTLPPSALQINSVLNKSAIGKFLLSGYHSDGKSAKTRLRAALLRFHPDKVRPWMNLIQESERNAVIMGVEIVVRCLNDLAKTAQ